MPTYARINRDGIPMHWHAPYNYWQWPWENHTRPGSHHDLHDVEYPIWVRNGIYGRRYYPTPAQVDMYQRALRGDPEIVGRTQERTANNRVASILDASMIIAVDQRRFGVEIECNAPIQVLRQNMLQKGLTVEHEGYNHSTVPYWKIVSDGSVRNTVRRAGFEAMELVSPILQGDAGLASLREATESLREVGARVNTTCGLHVHHDAADFDVDKAKTLARNYMRAQAAIDRLVSPSRRANQYCQPLNEQDLNYLDAPGRTLRDSVLSINRYRTLNLAALARHGTVEFRQHQGTIEYNKIASWVAFGQHIVDASVKGELIPSTRDLPVLYEAISLPETLREFFDRRAAEFAARSTEGRFF